jgi:hypothetical protein
MYHKKQQFGCQTSNEILASKPIHLKPKIKRTYHVGKGKDRVRMYESTDGKAWIADVVDRIFNPVATGPVRSKRFKGKNPHTLKNLSAPV